MNEFNEKYPYGDSFELAEFIYDKAWGDAIKSTKKSNADSNESD